jgi:hypothetical protein
MGVHFKALQFKDCTHTSGHARGAKPWRMVRLTEFITKATENEKERPLSNPLSEKRKKENPSAR